MDVDFYDGYLDLLLPKKSKLGLYQVKRLNSNTSLGTLSSRIGNERLSYKPKLVARMENHQELFWLIK